MRMAYLAMVAFEVCSLLHLLNCLLLRAQGKWGRDFLRDLESCKKHSWFWSSQKETLGGLRRYVGSSSACLVSMYKALESVSSTV